MDDRDKTTIRFGIVNVAGTYAYKVSKEQQDITAEYIQCDGAGRFSKTLNGLRSLRPGGQSRTPGPQGALPAGSENCRFYCQDPGRRESLLNRPRRTILTLTCGSTAWLAFPNVSPFEPQGHFLLIPSASFPELPHFPQLFTMTLFDDFVRICEKSRALVIAFCSRHAGASADHFHLQAICRNAALPMENARTETNSVLPDGVEITCDWPIHALVSESGEALKSAVMNLQSAALPFNLLFAGGRFFLAPRDANNEVARELPSMLGWLEVAGKFILTDEASYRTADESTFYQALARTGVGKSEVIRLLSSKSKNP